MDLQIQGKRALVSGSTKGIGLAIAGTLAAEGAHVVINGRSQASVDAGLGELRNDYPGVFADGRPGIEGFVGDLSTAGDSGKLREAYPEFDIVVNNLGIFEPKPFEEIEDSEWTRFFEVNVLSGVRLSRQYVGGMKQRGWGRIVFISSESAVQVPTEMIHYGMTKTAQLAVSRGLAEHLAGTGVTVNSVLPGPTHSAGVDEFVKQVSGGQPFDEFEEEFFKTVRPSSLIKRFATTQEVANMVAYVCSPLASATTGAALRVDGGVLRSCV
ncbi:MAG: SDR family NAD(P)-dependent oxidoreductase [Phycisphaerales bacterium JB063]